MKKWIAIVIALFILDVCAHREKQAAGYILETLPPDPEVIFTDPDYAVIDPPDGETYQFIISDVTKEMFEQYVDACRNGVFVNPSCDIPTTYQAYTEEGNYWISVSFYHPHEDMDSSNYIYVDVREV